ncbi:hypothetical protein CYMTET_29724, partial [Cymbomonas tetramitiformis]
ALAQVELDDETWEAGITYSQPDAYYCENINFEPASAINMLYGTFVLWMGWYAFNCGSTGGSTHGLEVESAHVAITTTLAAGAALNIGLIWSGIRRNGLFDITDASAACLGGLVAITPGCAVVEQSVSIIIGVIGAIAVLLALELLEKLQIDDPCGASAVHGGGGIVGILCVGFFHSGTKHSKIKCLDDPNDSWTYAPVCSPDCSGGDFDPRGLFYGGGAELLWVQFYGLGAILAWSAVLTIVTVAVIDKALGLRMTVREELDGPDISEHGYSCMAAYDVLTYPAPPAPHSTNPRTAPTHPQLA